MLRTDVVSAMKSTIPAPAPPLMQAGDHYGWVSTTNIAELAPRRGGLASRGDYPVRSSRYACAQPEASSPKRCVTIESSPSTENGFVTKSSAPTLRQVSQLA